MEQAIALGSQYDDFWQGLEAAIGATLDAGLAPDFQQIALRDARTVLSGAEWRDIMDRYSFGSLTAAVEGFMASGVIAAGSPEMVARALSSLIGELAAFVADAADARAARSEAEELIRRMLVALRAK